MSEHANTQIVRQLYENFKTGNMSGVLGSMAENVEWVLPEVATVPFSGVRRGRDAVGAFFKLLGEQQTPLKFEPVEFIAQGNKVVALGHYSWHVVSTGRNFQSEWAHAFTLQDGKIVKLQEYTDTANAAAAYHNPG